MCLEVDVGLFPAGSRRLFEEVHRVGLRGSRCCVPRTYIFYYSALVRVLRGAAVLVAHMHFSGGFSVACGPKVWMSERSR